MDDRSFMFGWLDRFISSGTSKPPSAAANRRAAEGYKDRGNAHLADGELQAAAACYRAAIEADAGYAEAHNNLGLTFAQQNDNDAAIACFRAAAALNPSLAQPHNNLGNAYRSLGRLEEAAACFREALGRDPDYPDAYGNLGVVYLELRQLDAARACFEHAIALKPDFAQAHNNLGMVFREQSQLEAALTCFRRATESDAKLPEAHNNLGTLAQDQGRFDEAARHYRQAVACRPDYAEAMSNALLSAQYDPSLSAADLYTEHLRFGERFEQPLRQEWPAHRNVRTADRKLRIGFVSGDLRSHPVGYFLENVLTQLDRKILAITLYPTNAHTDALSERLRKVSVAWHPIFGLPDEAAAQKIMEDGIDILVDLSGHTADNRLLLFARKPAPIQVTWLYFSTTGLRAMDYVLCDRYVLPPEAEKYFVERVWRLSDSYLCFTPPDDDVSVGPLPASANRYVTFGCFNNLSKLNGEVIECWSLLLREIPASRLFLKSRQLADDSMRRTVEERFAAHGIESSRLVLEGPSSRLDYLRSYGRVDIALDPFPFPGGTTTVEALWMGVPVLGRRGDRFISRAGESILESAALPEWIAADEADYLAKATAFAGRLDELAQLRATLRQRLLASPLCDAPRFARGLEAAFRGMWREFANDASVCRRA